MSPAEIYSPIHKSPRRRRRFHGPREGFVEELERKLIEQFRELKKNKGIKEDGSEPVDTGEELRDK